MTLGELTLIFLACGAATDNVSLKANLVRLGLNYRF